jgi:hypothetical protein
LFARRRPAPLVLASQSAPPVSSTFGGALLLVGLFTRPVAFVVSGEMAVACLQHAPRGDWPIVSGGELAVPTASSGCSMWPRGGAVEPRRFAEAGVTRMSNVHSRR